MHRESQPLALGSTLNPGLRRRQNRPGGQNHDSEVKGHPGRGFSRQLTVKH